MTAEEEREKPDVKGGPSESHLLGIEPVKLWAELARHYSSLRFVILPLYGAGLAGLVWLDGQNTGPNEGDLKLLVVPLAFAALLTLMRVGILVSRYMHRIDSWEQGRLGELDSGSRLARSLGLYDGWDVVFRVLTLGLVASLAWGAWVSLGGEEVVDAIP